jgi:hypothetical protein
MPRLGVNGAIPTIPICLYGTYRDLIIIIIIIIIIIPLG